MKLLHVSILVLLSVRLMQASCQHHLSVCVWVGGWLGGPGIYFRNGLWDHNLKSYENSVCSNFDFHDPLKCLIFGIRYHSRPIMTYAKLRLLFLTKKFMHFCQNFDYEFINHLWNETQALQNRMHLSWWHHQLETFSALLALCAGNSPLTGEFPAQRPVTQSFDVFCDLLLE